MDNSEDVEFVSEFVDLTDDEPFIFEISDDASEAITETDSLDNEPFFFETPDDASDATTDTDLMYDEAHLDNAFEDWLSGLPAVFGNSISDYFKMITDMEPGMQQLAISQWVRP